VAVEAIEGTDEAIRRGTRLSRPGAVVVKAVASTHDYRFDIPAIGPDTLKAMRDGGAATLAVQAGTTLLAYREEVLQLANQAGIAVVSVDGTARNAPPDPALGGPRLPRAPPRHA